MGTHAVVLGGSIAGLATARALSSHFDRVSFFEVANLLRPPTSMMSPEIAYRVLVGGRGIKQDSPARKSIV